MPIFASPPQALKSFVLTKGSQRRHVRFPCKRFSSWFGGSRYRVLQCNPGPAPSAQPDLAPAAQPDPSLPPPDSAPTALVFKAHSHPSSVACGHRRSSAERKQTTDGFEGLRGRNAAGPGVTCPVDRRAPLTRVNGAPCPMCQWGMALNVCPIDTCKWGLGSHARLGVFTLVTRGWAASEFLTRASKFNMMPNGEHQIIGPDRSQNF